MAGSIGATSYSAPINFAIAATPPVVNNINDVNGVVTNVYQTIQQIILMFQNNCGTAQQPSNQWPILEGQPSTILRQNLGRLYVTATEAIQFGAMISITSSGGNLAVRNANATDNTKLCDGFCSTSGGIKINQVGEVILGAGLASISGLTPGTRYFLSVSKGQVSATPASGTGSVSQYCGVALSSTQMYCSPSSSFVQN